MELNTDKYSLWECQDYYRVVVKDCFTASMLNYVTKYYPENTKFERYEEPVFKFHKRQLTKVMEILQN